MNSLFQEYKHKIILIAERIKGRNITTVFVFLLKDDNFKDYGLCLCYVGLVRLYCGQTKELLED